jgi:hypothetical protein
VKSTGKKNRKLPRFQAGLAAATPTTTEKAMKEKEKT